MPHRTTSPVWVLLETPVPGRREIRFRPAREHINNRPKEARSHE